MSRRNYNEEAVGWSTGFTGSHYLDVATPLMTLLNRSNQTLFNRQFVNGQPRYWNGEDFFNALTGKNLLLLATHGGPAFYGSFGNVTGFLTDRDDIDHLYPNVPSSPPDRELLTAQYPDFPQLKMDYSINPDFEGTFHRVLSYTSVMQGSGLTPFNSTGEPPLQILFSTACSLAHNPEIGSELAQEFLYPYKNLYVPTAPENQAAVLSIGVVSINKTRNYMVSFIELMEETFTVNQAVMRMRQDASLLPEGAFIVKGDPDATAVGVYTGTALLVRRDSSRCLQ